MPFSFTVELVRVASLQLARQQAAIVADGDLPCTEQVCNAWSLQLETPTSFHCSTSRCVRPINESVPTIFCLLSLSNTHPVPVAGDRGGGGLRGFGLIRTLKGYGFGCELRSPNTGVVGSSSNLYLYLYYLQSKQCFIGPSIRTLFGIWTNQLEFYSEPKQINRNSNQNTDNQCLA